MRHGFERVIETDVLAIGGCDLCFAERRQSGSSF